MVMAYKFSFLSKLSDQQLKQMIMLLAAKKYIVTSCHDTRNKIFQHHSRMENRTYKTQDMFT